MISILMISLPVLNRYIPEHRYKAFTLVSQLCYPGGLQSPYQLTREWWEEALYLRSARYPSQ